MTFLTTFIPTKTVYRAIGNNCIRFENHQICGFGKIWRLPEGEHCKIGSFSCEYKLFKIPFLTTFVSIKTLYDQIWNIFVNQIYLIFELFESGNFWRLLEGEWCILEGWSWKSMLFKMLVLTTFIPIIRLYNQIWQNYIFLNLMNKLKIIISNSMAIWPQFQILHHP